MYLCMCVIYIYSNSNVLCVYRHETPESNRRLHSDSFKMDPEEIKRIAHQSQLYTVISKSFKLGGSQREPDMAQPRKSAGDIHECGDVSPKSKSHRSSADSVDGGASRWSRPMPPVHPHQRQHHNQGARYDASRRDESNQYLQQSTRPLPPPHIIQHHMTDTELQTPSSVAMALRSPSAPLIEAKFDVDYDDIEDTEESPISSEGSSPPHQVGGAGGIRVQPLAMKQLPPSRRHGDLELQQQQQLLKPIPAIRHLPDASRHNKKQELHLKYTKIREQMMQKKQFVDETRITGFVGSEDDVGGISRGSVEDAHSGNHGKPLPSQAQPHGNKKHRQQKHRPTYTEVDEDLEITVEHLREHGQSGLWGLVRYPVSKPGDTMGRRSSSSRSLTSSDFYSNLNDLELETPSGGQLECGGTDSLWRRSHSFSGGMDKMTIPSTGSRLVFSLVLKINFKSST